MKMSESFLCCDSCFERIALQGVRLAKLWIDLCAIYTYENGVFHVILDDESHFTTIERLGYIVTTDVENGIVIHVCGQRFDHIGEFYCPGGCDDLEKE